MNDLRSKFIISLISNEFSEKFKIENILKNIDEKPEIIGLFSNEIQLAIDTYNNNRKSNQYASTPLSILSNTNHLRSIFDNLLPSYLSILDKLISDHHLYQQVLMELKTPYFKEVYEISNPLYLLQNLMILFYRTSLLYVYPELKEREAQISSTLEEMACVLEMDGIHTHMVEAIKHWVTNWQSEGFSPELAQAINKSEERSVK